MQFECKLNLTRPHAMTREMCLPTCMQLAVNWNDTKIDGAMSLHDSDMEMIIHDDGRKCIYMCVCACKQSSDDDDDGIQGKG